jgi:hypothetical protein
MGWLAFTLCKWFVGGIKLECKDLKWVTLKKHRGTLEFVAKQVVMVVA